MIGFLKLHLLDYHSYYVCPQGVKNETLLAEVLSTALLFYTLAIDIIGGCGLSNSNYFQRRGVLLFIP